MRYTAGSMARGWESKAIEDQRASAAEKAPRKQVRAATAREQEIARKREELELARKRALADLASAAHTRHRELLQNTLAAIEARIRALEGEPR